MNKTEHQKKAMLSALESSLGVVTTACKEIGIGRTTFYNWMKQDPMFALAVEEVQEVALDFAESQLFQQMKKGNAAAAIFFLKTRGKKRGYTELPIHHEENKAIQW